jgi:hypothetical protein
LADGSVVLSNQEIEYDVDISKDGVKERALGQEFFKLKRSPASN